MKYLTIGLAGQLGCGKDTAADYLCDRLNLTGEHGHWIRKGFAHAVKKVFMDTFQVDWEFVENWKRIREPPEGFSKNVRESLIFIGDGFRQIQPNIWIDIAFRDLRYHQIISDVRYLNEVNRIRAEGGLNILMWRPGHENDIKNDSEQQLMPFVNRLCELDPIPEGLLDPDLDMPFDMFIVNNGTVEDLYAKVDELIIPEVVRMMARHNGA
jgi:hypothetical protein